MMDAGSDASAKSHETAGYVVSREQAVKEAQDLAAQWANAMFDQQGPSGKGTAIDAGRWEEMLGTAGFSGEGSDDGTLSDNDGASASGSVEDSPTEATISLGSQPTQDDSLVSEVAASGDETHSSPPTQVRGNESPESSALNCGFPWK